MKRSIIAITVALAFSLGLSTTAGATASVNLVWVSTSNTDPSIVTGTSAILAQPGDHVGLEIFITAGPEGISAYGISLSFDTDVKVLHTPTEFGTPPAAFPCAPFPVCFTGPRPALTPLAPGVNGWSMGTPGFVLTFEAATLAASGVAFNTFGPMKIGEVWFEVQPGVSTDGADVLSGFFNPGVDAVLDNLNQNVTTVFGGAAVDSFAPEPGTATLLGLGLTGLVLAGRRKRS